jgi:hypothetical protein
MEITFNDPVEEHNRIYSNILLDNVVEGCLIEYIPLPYDYKNYIKVTYRRCIPNKKLVNVKNIQGLRYSESEDDGYTLVDCDSLEIFLQVYEATK